jgi:transcriptional regulator with PAS, ATPase and Fis domain
LAKPIGCSEGTVCSPTGASISVHPIWAELGLVTQSPELLTTLQLAETYAPSTIPVLLLGETGAGKDLLAQGTHALSGREGPLVPVNCAAASKELFVAELFGARRGAYTGSVEHRRGLIQEANGGTILLDEIADLDPEAQGFLLRFLDTGEVRAIGDTTNHRVQARVVAATCRDLCAHVQQGLFRNDLYGRLAGALLQLPPLRTRSRDFSILIDMLWRRSGGDPADCRKLFDTDLIALLRHLRWPGNVRELKYLVERALLFYRKHGVTSAREVIIQCVQRPHYVEAPPTEHGSQQQPEAPESHPSTTPVRQTHRRKRRTEWDPDELRKALDEADGYIPEAARALGISRSHAYRLYKQLEECDVRSG